MKKYCQIVFFVSIIISPLSSPLNAKTYKGAEYRTKESFLYGRFEVRMKSAQREGMLSSFFTYNDITPSIWNEIDIEIMGRFTDDVQLNTITPGQSNHVSHQFVAFNPSLDFHTYAIEWTPAYVSWSIDGGEVYRQTGAHIATLNLAQKIMMNIWPPTYVNWAGNWNDAVLPAFAYYDWVSYASYTPGAGSYGSGNNFSPQWKDDFNSWDQNRWQKATHTWDGNNCDFVYDNAVIKDGYLILCLTQANALGYTDAAPPVPLWARSDDNTITVFFSEEIEQSSAENSANYILVGGGTVASAVLNPDMRSVLLTVPQLDTSTLSSLAIQKIRDRWTTPNTMTPRALTVTKGSRMQFPFKINAGGPAYGLYAADQDWSEKTEYGHVDGSTYYNASAQINGTTEQEIYRSELSGHVQYKIRVPNGSYLVSFMMADKYFTDADKRIFTIVAEGDTVEANIDLVQKVGARTAYQRTKPLVIVKDGILDIHFQAAVDQPLINGIVIYQLATSINEKFEPFPRRPSLSVNYPNPFNPTTRFTYDVVDQSMVSLRVYDSIGREISTIVNEEKAEGSYIAEWNAAGLPSGAYLCRFDCGTTTEIRKMILER